MEHDCERKARAKKKNNCYSVNSNLRNEALFATIEKKKQCNDKALKVVANLSENTVDGEFLSKNLHFIDQGHYQDIVEERAINKLCGYPLCPNRLENIPAKQYHISTLHNKVFDITERKNFCSNLCYKASKYLKDQVLTSPLWLRDNNDTGVRILSFNSKGGFAGEEVDFGVSHVKTDSDGVLNNKTNTSDVTKQDFLSFSSVEKSSESFNRDVRVEHVSSSDELQDASCLVTETNPSGCSKVNGLVNVECEKESTILIENVQGTESGSPLLLEISNSKMVDDSKSSYDNQLDECYKKNTTDNVLQSQLPQNQCVTVAMSPATSSELHTDSSLKSESSSIKISKKKSKRTSSPLLNAVMNIEHILKEWFTLDSLCFSFGEEKVKEMLAEKTNKIKEHISLTGGSITDTQFYERYLAICKKLNILELEDSKLDASFRQEVKNPLPDYEVLKKEAEELELKVKMFYKGDKLVQFEQAEDCAKEDKFVSEPILPLVDLHAQKALRRRIVFDKLRRILQDLQLSLGLRGFSLGEDVRSLVSTFNLSAHNITMKPAEWNLIALVIIKLLSLRDKALEQNLSSSCSTKHLTLLLMSYSLDGGYLDRLISWLTDVDSLLPKE